MAFSSGTFSLYTPGNPVVTGTTISSAWGNNTLNDIATGLSTCVLKDGSQTITANIPMGGFKFTGLAAGSASGNSIRYEQVNGVVTTAGDMLYASAAGTLARLALGTAGGMIQVNAAATAPEYLAIGTARQVATVNAGATALAYANPITIMTAQATTSGTAFDFTSIPVGVRRIVMYFNEISLSGTDNYLVQLGDAGGPETGTYVSTSVGVANAAASVGVDSTSGFIVYTGNAGNILSGFIILQRVTVGSHLWVASHTCKANTTSSIVGGGTKTLSAELDQIRLTRTGTDTFDSGSVQVSYE